MKFHSNLLRVKRKTNQEMNKENEMLKALFNNSSEGIIICNQIGEIILVNPKGLSLFGYSENELLGSKIEVLIPKRFHNKHESHREDYSEKPKSRSMGGNMDLFAVRKNGTEFPVEISLSPFYTNNKQFIVSFIIDITVRKQNEAKVGEAHREISILNEQLEAKVKERTKELARAMELLAKSKNELVTALEKEKNLNELKSAFITTASHEFRTPLGAILSSASLISKYTTTEDQEKRLKHINRIKSSVANLTEILNDFLSLDKLDEGLIRNQPVFFKIKEFIKSIIDEVSPILKRGQSIQYISSGNQEEAFFDKQLLRNVIINLISNSVKYSPENKLIKVSLNLSDNLLIIDVIDEGFGIPEEDQKHIFESFFRANNAGNIQGTGLGLNIVKKHIDIMGGTITFKSNCETGTTFSIKLSF
jgi:PAS domain S-box-containing protein